MQRTRRTGNLKETLPAAIQEFVRSVSVDQRESVSRQRNRVREEIEDEGRQTVGTLRGWMSRQVSYLHH